MDEALNRVANGLRALDLGPARRVAVFAENTAETVLAHLGGLLAGASTVPANFHLNAEELAYILEDSGTRVALRRAGDGGDRPGRGRARRALPLVVGWRCRRLDGLTPWEAWLAAADPTRAADRRGAAAQPACTRRARRGGPRASELPPTMFAGGDTIAEHLDALASNAFARFGTHLVVGPMYHTGPLSGVRLLAAGVPVGGPRAVRRRGRRCGPSTPTAPRPA